MSAPASRPGHGWLLGPAGWRIRTLGLEGDGILVEHLDEPGRPRERLGLDDARLAPLVRSLRARGVIS